MITKHSFHGYAIFFVIIFFACSGSEKQQTFTSLSPQFRSSTISGAMNASPSVSSQPFSLGPLSQSSGVSSPHKIVPLEIGSDVTFNAYSYGNRIAELNGKVYVGAAQNDRPAIFELDPQNKTSALFYPRPGDPQPGNTDSAISLATGENNHLYAVYRDNDLGQCAHFLSFKFDDTPTTFLNFEAGPLDLQQWELINYDQSVDNIQYIIDANTPPGGGNLSLHVALFNTDSNGLTLAYRLPTEGVNAIDASKNYRLKYWRLKYGWAYDFVKPSFSPVPGFPLNETILQKWSAWGQTWEQVEVQINGGIFEQGQPSLYLNLPHSQHVASFNLDSVELKEVVTSQQYQIEQSTCTDNDTISTKQALVYRSYDKTLVLAGRNNNNSLMVRKIDVTTGHTEASKVISLKDYVQPDGFPIDSQYASLQVDKDGRCVYLGHTVQMHTPTVVNVNKRVEVLRTCDLVNYELLNGVPISGLPLSVNEEIGTVVNVTDFGYLGNMIYATNGLYEDLYVMHSEESGGYYLSRFNLTNGYRELYVQLSANGVIADSSSGLIYDSVTGRLYIHTQRQQKQTVVYMSSNRGAAGSWSVLHEYNNVVTDPEIELRRGDALSYLASGRYLVGFGVSNPKEKHCQNFAGNPFYCDGDLFGFVYDTK